MIPHVLHIEFTVTQLILVFCEEYMHQFFIKHLLEKQEHADHIAHLSNQKQTDHIAQLSNRPY